MYLQMDAGGPTEVPPNLYGCNRIVKEFVVRVAGRSHDVSSAR
jgi:hypothetical protein